MTDQQPPVPQQTPLWVIVFTVVAAIAIAKYVGAF